MASAFWNVCGASLQPILRLADKTKITGKIKPLAPVLPVPPKPVETSSFREIDEHLRRLDACKSEWVQLGTKQRAQLLTQCLRNFMTMTEQFARAGTEAKGSYEGGIGDEM